MQMLDERGRVLTEALQDNAGDNSVSDARASGYIRAIKDLLLVTYEETQEQ